MAKIIGFIMCVCAMSLFFFPVALIGMPANVNTKLAMAVIGIPILIYNLSKSSNARIDSKFILLLGLAGCVSLATYLSVVLNNTMDYTYVTYVASMAVWTSAAYVVVKMIQGVHGYVNVRLVVLYLMVICTLQCILAIAIDLNADVQQFVDQYYHDAAFFHEKERMYGFGCGLDVAGGRFAAILTMIAYLLYNNSKKSDWLSTVFYMTCFIVISVIGNMIGRTTTIGMVLGMIIIIYSMCAKGANPKFTKSIVGLIVTFSFMAIILYNSSPQWRKNLKFGFEGFFSLVERGKWEVHSNDMLKEGFIYPKNLKTWLIGDGYFDEPSDTTPYYTGKSFYGYYMGTDAGYSRFLFYFGLIGLLLFSAFFVSVAISCAQSYPKYKYMFWSIVLLNFVYWIKVSTDLYVTLAPFVCLSLMNLPEKKIDTDMDRMGQCEK